MENGKRVIVSFYVLHEAYRSGRAMFVKRGKGGGLCSFPSAEEGGKKVREVFHDSLIEEGGSRRK